MDKLRKLIRLFTAYLEWKKNHEKGWFGKIEVSIEDSDIVNTKVTENIKL